MGYGSYDGEAHKAMTTARATLPREEVFKSVNLHPTMDPKGVEFRESRDSAEHPDSIGIIFALDETGSMQGIPKMLAYEELPGFMSLILDGGFVRDPQVLFMGIGDAVQSYREESPLQVGQFESEAHLMDQWLTRIHLEGKGGGNQGESYDLAFYFAARHTAMDCWEKRGRKGYLFVTGDEEPLPVNAHAVRDRIGDDVRKDIPMEKIVEEASKTFHCFFLIPDLMRAERCERPWREVLGDNAIVMEDPHDTCAVAATLIGLTEGTLEDLQAAAAKLKELGKPRAQIDRVIRAVEPYANAIGRGGERRQAEQGDAPAGRGTRGNRRR
jgi:hypothetical protein